MDKNNDLMNVKKENDLSVVKNFFTMLNAKDYDIEDALKDYNNAFIATEKTHDEKIQAMKKFCDNIYGNLGLYAQNNSANLSKDSLGQIELSRALPYRILSKLGNEKKIMINLMLIFLCS